MLYRVVLLALLLSILWQGSASATDLDEQPGFDFFRQSSATAPCGRGSPPPGHFPWEIRPSTLPDGLKLTVKQAGDRLCYAVGGKAEAPVIRVRQGEDLTITLRNEITDPAAIDRAVAPGTLKQPNPTIASEANFYAVIPGTHHTATGMTNLHVHGFAVPPARPQDEVLTTCVDPAVGPAVCGMREFTYRYHIPANMPEGLYWYHPHIHGEVQAQILMGLAGAIVVEGPKDDARRAAGIADRVFVVTQTRDREPPRTPPAADAVTAGASGTAASVTRSKSANLIDTAHELACGRAGVDELLLNGLFVPHVTGADEELGRVEIPSGGTELWRVLNASTDAFLDLAVVDQQDDTPLPIRIVARDGAPLTDDAGTRVGAAATTAPQLVPPAGRVEFLIQAPPHGHSAYLVTRGVDTGCAGDWLPERRLVLITPREAQQGAIATPAVASASDFATPARPDIFSGLLARKTDHRRVIAFAEYPRPGAEDAVDYYIAERKPGAVLEPYRMGGPPAITVHAGTTEEWLVENWTNELHAFHIHQIHFRLLEVNGKPEPDTPLLDVATVPAATGASRDITSGGAVTPGRILVKLTFPGALAGDIPFHCHLADHEDNGMMAILRVLPDGVSANRRRAQNDLDQRLGKQTICHADNGAVASR